MRAIQTLAVLNWVRMALVVASVVFLNSKSIKARSARKSFCRAAASTSTARNYRHSGSKP
jgi:hypothetical protein